MSLHATMAPLGASTANQVSLDVANIVPIAQLDTTRPPPPQTRIRAVVALIYPFSSHTQSAAVLLADPDMRQRKRKGQVRVQFHGPAAVAFGTSRVGSGDELLLRLEGARWVEEDTSAVHTPGRSVDAELSYDRRLVLEATREASVHATVDIDAPAPSPSSPSNGQGSQSSSSPPAPTTTPALSRAKSRMNFGYDIFHDHDLTPIMYDDENYDPFLHDDKDDAGHRRPRKRTKLGRKSGEWKLVGWHQEHPLDVDGGETLPDTPLPRKQKDLLPLSIEPLLPPALETGVIDLISPDVSAVPPSLSDAFQIPDEYNARNQDSFTPGLNDIIRDANHQSTTSIDEPPLGYPEAREGFLAQHVLSNPPADTALNPVSFAEQPEEPRTSQFTRVSAVEPLFGPGVPTNTSKAFNMPYQSAQHDLSKPKDQENVHQPDLADTSAIFVDAENRDPPIPERSQASIQEHPAEYPAAFDLADTSSNQLSVKQDSPSQQQYASMDSSQPAGDFVQPNAPASASRPQMAITLPQSPLLEPIPSHNLPLISPFPLSPMGSSQLPMSTADSFQPPASTPPTSQSVPQSQERYSPQPEVQKEALSSPTPSQHPSPAPDRVSVHVDGSVEPDVINKVNSQVAQRTFSHTDAVDEKALGMSSNVFEQTNDIQSLSVAPQPLGKTNANESFKPEHAISLKGQIVESDTSAMLQLDGAADAKDTYNTPVSKDVTRLDVEDAELVKSPLPINRNHLATSDRARAEGLAKSKLPQDIGLDKDKSGSLSGAPLLDNKQKQMHPTGTDDKSEAIFTPRRHSRPSTIPESLSPFFEVVPPRRSGRQTKPTEKVKIDQEVQTSTRRGSTAPKSPTETRNDAHQTLQVAKSSDALDKATELAQPHPAAQEPGLQQAPNKAEIGPSKEILVEKSLEKALSEKPLPDLEQDAAIAIVQGRNKGFRTSLSYYASLQNIDVYLTASSSDNHGSLFDVFAVVTSATSPIARAKSGPRHHYTVLHMTDASPARPNVLVECFRPRKDALPVANRGDVMLLREPVVKSRDGELYLLSGSTSAWHVWRFDSSAGHGADVKTDGTTVVEECRGPQVELGFEEQQHAHALRAWWLSVRDDWHEDKKSIKASPSQRRDKAVSNKSPGKRLKGKQKRS